MPLLLLPVGMLAVGDDLREWMAVFVVFNVDGLKTHDRDLAPFEHRNPVQHQQEDDDLEHRVRLLQVPWRIVPLLGDAVDHHEECEHQQQR